MPQLSIYKRIHQKPCFLILHMFSGRRRATDLHAALEELTHNKPFTVKVLSCDTAVDPEYGNLISTGSSWKNIEELLRTGCMTCTEARHWIPDDPTVDTSRWPRPLRSAERPWGLADLLPKELRQLGFGSNFSLQTLWVMACLLRSGGVMLSEHPAPPKAPERVSIFTTPVAMLLRSFPEINLSVFLQGWWGAEAWKPTGLLALRLSKIHTSMNKWRLENPPTTFTPAIGRSSDGKFNTAAFRNDSLMEWRRPFQMNLRPGSKMDSCARLRLSSLLPLSDG